MATILLLVFACGTVSAADLRTLRSAHYVVHTDLERSLAEEMAQRLDAMYDDYARRLAAFEFANPEEKFEVYLFANRDDFMRLTQSRFANSSGIFMPGRNILAAYLEGQGRDALRQTMQHEAFHQFAFMAIGPGLPTWLNEGMAEYFKEGIWNGSTFAFGHVPPRRLRQLHHDIAKRQLVPFRTMLTMTDQQWQEGLIGDADRGATQYNQAWAMTHFLIHGANGNERYRPRLIETLRRIHGGEDGTDAFIAAFSRNVDGFQARFEEFAATLQSTPEATLIERQGVLADMLAEYLRRGRRFSDVRTFREEMAANSARITYSKGSVQWKTASDARVYFCDVHDRLYEPNELHFDFRGDAPLPDLVCRGTGVTRFRTRFYHAGDRIEHETLCEPQAQAR